MSKMSKMCLVAFYSTRIDGIKVFIHTTLYLGMYFGSRGDCHKRNQCSVRKWYLYYIVKKAWCIFWPATFESSTHRRRKLMFFFGILTKFRARNMCFLYKTMIWKYDLIWRDLDLTSIQKSGWKTSHSQMSHYWYIRAKWPRKHVSHGMFVTFILKWPFATWSM